MYMARQMLIAHLSIPGLSLEKQGRAYTPPLDVTDALSSHWSLALPQILDQVMVFGFVVIVLRRDAAKRLYPYVLAPDTYQITMIDGLETTYEIHSRFELPKDVLVYDHFGMIPTQDGNGNVEITSTYVKCFEKLEFLKTLRASCRTMEVQKSRPKYFAEMHETTQEKQEGVDFDYYVQDDSADTRQDEHFTRNKTNIDILKNQQDMYDEMLRDGRNKNSGLAPNNLKDIVQLPAGLRVVHTAQNTARQDLAQLHKILQEELCTTIGVPRALLVADSQFKSSTDGVEAVFNNTIEWWRGKLSILFTDLYTKVYVLPTKTKVPKGKQMYKDKLKNEIKVIINVKVQHEPIDLEQLQKLYDAGVITWEALVNGCSKITGMPLSLLNSTPPAPPEPPPEPPQKKRRTSSNVHSSDVVAVAD